MFKKKRKNENADRITYDEVKDAYIFDGHSVRAEKLDSGRYMIDIDGRQYYHTEMEFEMMFIYFSLMYRRMDE